MQITGIVFGLAAAASQSASYVFSRSFVVGRKQPVLRLFVLSHLIMGFISLAILPFVWPGNLPPVHRFHASLAGTAVFYMMGQCGFFFLVKRIDASRAAPLLGLKIVVLALVTTLFMDRGLGGAQWLAVLLCACAALILNFSGGSLSRHAVLWLFFVCIAYSLSDLSIEFLVKDLQPLSRMRASVVGACFTYVACGVVTLFLFPAIRKTTSAQDWLEALPFAVFWFLGMVFLYICFASIGAVYGNILQSTRGILSIVLGAAMARGGLHHLEQKVVGHVLLRRAAAALLMVAAIWLFSVFARPGG